MLINQKTSPEEFENFVKLLKRTPIFIPIVANDKKPEIPAGESWKDPKHHLTVEQAIIRLCDGKNVGVVANDWLVIVDLDNPKKFKLDKKTLTVETRNGKLHMYYINAGDVENSVGKNSLAKCGEVRAEWQYVLAPGSFVPCDDGKYECGTGLYRIIEPLPLETLHKSDLPEDFVPTSEHIPINPEILNKAFTNRNKYGWSIEDIRYKDKKLDVLLNNSNEGYPSGSEADMATLTKLLFWEFDEGEAVAILRKFRYRPKLDRSDYITNTLGRISHSEKISNKIDPLKWNPKTGYMIELNFGPEEKKTSTSSSPTGENGKLNLDAIINEFKTQYIFKTPIDTEELYFYKEGIYKEAEAMIKNLLENSLGAKATIHVVNEILEHLRWSSYVDRSEFNKYSGFIPVQNGLVNLETGELKPFTPDQIFTFKLHVKFDKEATCPIFEKWLAEVQSKDNITTLQEYAGYCLLPEMPFHKSIWFIGGGRNGKGTYIHTLENVFGKTECFAYVPIQLLNGERNFAEAQLYGKLINVSSEPTTKKELETPLFKKLTGDDFIEAEIKGKQKHIGFHNVAKFYILGNKYPRVRDNTDAFKERIIVIKWEHQYLEGQGQIPKIEHTWLKSETEKSGILNWMIRGLQRLLTNNKFSLTLTQKEMMIEFERASDSIAAWIDERIIKDPKELVLRETPVEDYLDYCDYYGIFVADKNKLFDRLRNTPGIKETKTRIAGKQERIWKGMKIKPKLDSEEEEVSTPNNQPSMTDFTTPLHKSGTVGTDGTAKKKQFFSSDNTVKVNDFQMPVPTVPTVPDLHKAVNPELEAAIHEINTRTCKSCGKFHLPSCAAIGDFSKLTEDHWAGECRGYLKKQDEMANPGGDLT
jgi:P4 family phage/plasmid primase-like protien